jgi:hypothetical protein
MIQCRLRLARLAVLAAAAGAAGSPAFAACVAPPDVLPVALPNAAAAVVTQTGVAADGGTAWMISGVINRCVAGGAATAEVRTPPQMGITERASIQLAISGVTLNYGNEAIENLPTEWRLTAAPTVSIADKNNTDPSKNLLEIAWQGAFLNVTSYQLSYTIFLVQK